MKTSRVERIRVSLVSTRISLPMQATWKRRLRWQRLMSFTLGSLWQRVIIRTSLKLTSRASPINSTLTLIPPRMMILSATEREMLKSTWTRGYFLNVPDSLSPNKSRSDLHQARKLRWRTRFSASINSSSKRMTLCKTRECKPTLKKTGRLVLPLLIKMPSRARQRLRKKVTREMLFLSSQQIGKRMLTMCLT